MDYPHETYLCDEDDNEYLRSFCEQNNIIHVTRKVKKDAKAGNINNALKTSTGDICVIIDPDHIPETNFLTELLPYFEDDTIGFVQSVQGYYNQEESKVALGAAEQTYQFYGPVMMSMNSYGTVNAIGANCVFRRKALDSIGGHASGLSEDMHTAMRLYAKGWKSVYVPKMLTKGLVPSTLTSYFKQQLKWSRGTFELLISAFPKLFSTFTLRQKLHFGIIPLHYLSGIVYFIILLIPILSLFLSTTPWKGNIYNFWLITLPVFVSILGIRLFVQRWLVEKSERGIHVTGGLLFHTTWSIYVLGVFYSLIRKKVPYIPTPKTSEGRTALSLLLPNLVMGALSIVAIVVGLQRDFTPFSLFMSGFALWNASDMFYTLVFAFEKPKPISFGSDNFPVQKSFLKNQFFSFWQSFGILFVLIIFSLSVYFQFQNEKLKMKGMAVEEIFNTPKFTYLGAFYPDIDNGYTNISKANQFGEKHAFHPDVLSVYLPWSKDVEKTFPQTYLDSIYNNQSLPLLTWEPWTSSFPQEETTDRNVYELINEGYFDSFISQFALKIKNLRKPIFLRFAHEFDNPFYPWFIENPTMSLPFKEAWVRTHSIFEDVGAQNVIWVWNPWKSENVIDFYPGDQFVDWVGLNILNYSKEEESNDWHSFSDLYLPYKKILDSITEKPVIITEFGSLRNNEQSQLDWIQDGVSSLPLNFPEVQALIFFNSHLDSNIPQGFNNEHQFYDWTFADSLKLKLDPFKGDNQLDDHHYLLSEGLESSKENLYKDKSSASHETLENIIGVNINKGQDWKSDYHVLNRFNLERDFQRMKEAGINTVKFLEKDTYDFNLLNISKEKGLKVVYSFYIPSNISFLEENEDNLQLKNQILSTVKDYQKYDHITSWCFENDIYSKLYPQIKQPDLTLYSNGYLNWLKGLLHDIKKISRQKIYIGIEGEGNFKNKLEFYSEVLGKQTGVNLMLKDDKLLKPSLDKLQDLAIPFSIDYLGESTSNDWKELAYQNSFYYVSWQDQFTINKLTFDGLVDRKGRLKNTYYEFIDDLGLQSTNFETKTIRILKQNKSFYSGNIVVCYAMFYNPEKGWKVGGGKGQFKYEWDLLKYNDKQECISIEKVGTGSHVYLKIPEDTKHHKLMLTVINDKNVVTQTFTELSNP